MLRGKARKRKPIIKKRFARVKRTLLKLILLIINSEPNLNYFIPVHRGSAYVDLDRPT